MKKEMLIIFAVAILFFNMFFVFAGGVEVLNVFPKEFDAGDAQLNIQVRNIDVNNKTLENIFAFVSGKGFSTYDVVPIDYLDIGDKSYILVFGNFRESGIIPLSININEEIFYENITIKGAYVNQSVISDSDKKAEELNQRIINLTMQLSDLSQKYDELDENISLLADDNYDVSKLDLKPMKSYLRDAQANILVKNVVQAEVNLNLALNEYNDLNRGLVGLKKIPLVKRIKENALLFSTFAGAIITFFALYELLKRKEEHVVERINRLKVKEKKEKTEK